MLDVICIRKEAEVNNIYIFLSRNKQAINVKVMQILSVVELSLVFVPSVYHKLHFL